MKTRNLIMAACAVSALAASCEKTGGGNDTGTTSGEKPKILATIDMSPKASNGYLVPVYDLTSDGASMDEAYEVKTSNYVIMTGHFPKRGSLQLTAQGTERRIFL